MIDPYADLRARYLDLIAQVTAACCERHQQRLERAHRPGDLERQLAALHRDIDQATRPLVAAYAKLPPPPVEIRL